MDALARSTAFGAAAPAKLLETHISYVLLTGDYAYKIKKAVDFDFLDFRTLAARRFFCEEELRLNRRLAPTLYLDVVPITGSIDKPFIGGSEQRALEYAVKMREFAQEALAGKLLERCELGASDIDVLADKVARFHGAIGIASPDAGFGAPEGILRVALQNFVQLAPLLASEWERDELEDLCSWTGREHAARHDAFLRRRTQGFVRECHGDLHLGNIARIDDELVIFDGIEFSEEMRWIDVMSEVAFTVMDLQDRRRADLAHRFLNAYLDRTGDYGGLAVLPFYLTYRALVRAKIARLRATQVGAGAAKNAAIAESRGYLHLARSYAERPRPALIVTYGLSGSGKTAISQALLETIGAVRIRSDVERKRMHGVAPLERCNASEAQRLYAEASTQHTYDRLRTLARDILGAGRIAIVDATFLRHSQRESFRALAMELGLPFLILAFEASEATLRQRITQRQAGGGDASDADLAVLGHQIATREPLTADERTHAVVYDAEAPLEAARAPAAWKELARRLGGSRTLRNHSRSFRDGGPFPN
ncbi:MAG TPA: AAA family ATPase [Casimicrobiaceae bacterium]|nr:AAA family ATPase [Casimicrobiaceae bacterium]